MRPDVSDRRGAVRIWGVSDTEKPEGSHPMRAAVPMFPLIFKAGVAAAIVAGRSPAGASNDPESFERATAVRFDSVALPTGVTLHYAERGEPQGRAIIMLHGYSDSWFSYSRILPMLPVSLHVYALDQRGHGRSTQPDSGYEMSELGADVTAFMNAKNIESAVLVGHSMGSLVAQQAAVQLPGRVDGIVLIAGGPDVSRLPGLDEFVAAIDSLEDPVPAEFVRGFQESTVHKPVPAEFMNQVVAESSRLRAAAWKKLVQGMPATPPAAALTARRIPALLVWGDRDGYFRRDAQDAQDALLELLPGAVLKVYDETGHAPHWEQPESVAADIAAFVDGL